MITIQQIKGARGILGWSQDELAKAARISRLALNNMERGVTAPRNETMQRVRMALEKGGIEFITGGCRMREETLDVKVFEGEDALLRVYDDMIVTFTGTGGVCYISGVEEKKFVEACGDKFEEYMETFVRIGVIDNMLAKEGDTNFVEALRFYRWVPEEIFLQVPYMIYGDKYAIILWGPPLKIILIHNAEIAASFLKQFKAHWNRAKIPAIDSRKS